LKKGWPFLQPSISAEVVVKDLQKPEMNTNSLTRILENKQWDGKG
jgi:hypothetical protein